jgi:hypothetical protein
VRLLVTRSTAPDVGRQRGSSSPARSSAAPQSPSLICGVIFRIVPTSCAGWSGKDSPVVPPVLPPVLVNWPVTNGTSCATLISASSLSMRHDRPVSPMMLVFGIRAARDQGGEAGARMPAPGRPPPIVRGPCRWRRQRCRIAALGARMPSPTDAAADGFGIEARDPAMFSRSASTGAAAQFTPSSEALSALTSTIIASTSTCTRRMSSLSIDGHHGASSLGGAVITSALVGLIRPDRDAALGGVAPPRGAGLGSGTAALLLVLLLQLGGQRSLASA